MQFQPGKSGNPSGRYVGSKNKNTKLVKLLEPHAEALIDKAIELVLSGNTNMLRLCIERLIPKAKEETVKFVIPNSPTLSKEEVIKTILQALSGHELNLIELKNFLSITHYWRLYFITLFPRT